MKRNLTSDQIAKRSISQRAAKHEIWGKVAVQLADGRVWTEADMLAISPISTFWRFLSCLRLIPWLNVQRMPAGYRFAIDQELRAICEDRAARPQLNGAGVRDFVRNLAQEIYRRRKENNEKPKTRNWNTDNILKTEQRLLLDWIEAEVSKLDQYLASGAEQDSADRTENHPIADAEVNECTPKQEPVLRC